MSLTEFDTIDFDSRDGVKCNLKHPIGQNPTKSPVLLVHGAGVRANIFNPPTSRNLIHCLMEEGYDVWLENWRGSIDFPPNNWDLDQAGLFDHPAAVKKVVELTGANQIMAIVHCQGSTGFMISAMLGLVPEVNLIISNAVSLHPVVPKYSLFKLWNYIPLVGHFFQYLDPQWGLKAPDLKSKVMKILVQATHHERDTLVGKFVSFIYGAGFPALWRLENLDKATMDWAQHEFAAVPLTFFQHIKKCVKEGMLLPLEEYPGRNYVPDHVTTDARVILFTGSKNKCFLPESQQRTFEYLERQSPGKHRLYMIENYSHLDIFFGKNAHTDVFPLMIKELNKTQNQCLQKE